MSGVLKNSFKLVRLVKTRNIFTTCILNNGHPYDLYHPQGQEPSIPRYVERESESVSTKRARLLYQSRKRGMLENGLLLSTFAKKYLDSFNEEQLKLYDRLINLPSNDWDIFYWATDVKPVPSEFQNEIMELLKKHIRNEDREARIAQPELN